MEQPMMVARNGVITSIRKIGKYKSIQIDGIGVNGVVLNVDENTVIRNQAGEVIGLDDLAVGMVIHVQHSLAMTMSLPPQTYAYSITIQSS